MNINFCKSTRRDLKTYINDLEEEIRSKTETTKYFVWQGLSLLINLVFIALWFIGVEFVEREGIFKTYVEYIVKYFVSPVKFALFCLASLGVFLFTWGGVCCKFCHIFKDVLLSDYYRTKKEVAIICAQKRKLIRLLNNMDIVDDLRSLPTYDLAYTDFYKEDDGFTAFLKFDGFIEKRYFVVDEKEELKLLIKDNLLDFSYLDEKVEKILSWSGEKER